MFMFKTVFESYCDECPYFLCVDNETKLYSDANVYSVDHVITCEHIDICRRVADETRKEIAQNVCD